MLTVFGIATSSSLIFNFLTFSQAPEFHRDNSPKGFVEDATTHFGCTEGTVGEDDGDFFQLESHGPCREFHFDLEGIAFETDVVEINGFQNFPGVANESGCGVMYFHARDKSHVLGGEIGHEYSSHGPVHDVNTCDVTGADCHIAFPTFAGVIQFNQIIGIVGKIGIHFEDVIVPVFQ